MDELHAGRTAAAERCGMYKRGKCKDHSGRADIIQTQGYKGRGLGVKCIYANARSVMSKLDYLRAEVQVIDPDIIAISES